MNNKPIGVFDSGIGGLSVVKEILKNLPDEEIVYFGDCARVPYGELTSETITEYTMEMVSFLQKNDVKAFVVACNTICVTCLKELQEMFDFPVIGVIKPGVDAAAKVAKNSVLLLATAATVKTESHKNLLLQQRPNLDFHSQVCSIFVPIVEEGFAENEAAFYIAKEYLKDIKSKNIDTIILGCTHYQYLIKAIKRATYNEIEIINPSYGTAMDLKASLIERNLLAEQGRKTLHKFYCSGQKEKFDNTLKTMFGDEYSSEVKLI